VTACATISWPKYNPWLIWQCGPARGVAGAARQGQEGDWFGLPFITTFAVVATVCLISLGTILPSRDQYIVTTSEFDTVKNRLRRLNSRDTFGGNKNDNEPTLRVRTE
jgi:hypothetical protein